jgi:hypothetical protein
MRGAAAAVTAMVAIGCGSAPPAAQTTATPPPPPPPPSTPPPEIHWAQDHFELRNLPAIAKASEIIVAADPLAAPDQLHVETRDRDDKVVATIAVSATTVADANHQLAILHGVHDLRAMRPLDVEPAHDGEDQHWATGDNLDVEWRDHKLSVFRHNITDALVVADGETWLATDSGACHFPAYLRDAFHAEHHDVMLVVIGYRSSEGCTAPPDQLHVLAWYPK